MELQEVLGRAGDAITVRRVYGEPYEKEGITVIPGAAVAGGGGGGGGRDPQGQTGEGGGFGVAARPAGAFVIKDGRVSWRPALDLNQLLMMAGSLATMGLLIRAGQRRRAQQAELVRGRGRGKRRGMLRRGKARKARASRGLAGLMKLRSAKPGR